MTPRPHDARVIVVMGVTGSGKTTVGRAAATLTGGIFLDGDDFHPPANIAKMQSGQPLDDQDRAGWLEALREVIADQAANERPAFLACSALRDTYRQILARGHPHVRFAWLKGDAATIRARMAKRTDHFMPPDLLDSQFATLEEPRGVLALDIRETPEALAARIAKAFALPVVEA